MSGSGGKITGRNKHCGKVFRATEKEGSDMIEHGVRQFSGEGGTSKFFKGGEKR